MSYAYAAKQAVPASTVPEGAPEGWPPGWTFPPPAYPPGWECQDVPGLVAAALSLATLCRADTAYARLAEAGFSLEGSVQVSMIRSAAVAAAMTLGVQCSAELAASTVEITSTTCAHLKDENVYAYGWAGSYLLTGNAYNVYRWRPMIYFPLSGLSYSSISSATLRLYFNSVNVNPTLDTSIRAARILQSAIYGYCSWTRYSWTGSWLPWASAGCASVGTDRTALGSAASVPGTHAALASFDVDVTAFTRSWLVDGAANHGLLLVNDDESNSLKKIEVYSPSPFYYGLSAYRPKLIITGTPN